MSEPLNIFVSYSHQDKRWLTELQVHLKPLIRDEQIDVWDDTRIKAGAQWKEEIDRALRMAQVAILLVSKHFLASDFIHKEELQPLLHAAEQRGVVILPLIVGRCRFQKTKSLSVFQAVNDPKRPLASIRLIPQRDEVFVQLTDLIEEAWESWKKKKERELFTAQPIQALQPEHETRQTQMEAAITALPETWQNDLGMTFVRIPTGTFMMGSNRGRDNEKPEHKVTISKPFYLGKYAVTQAQWELVMGDNPSGFKGERRPVERVSWNEVQYFVRQLNERDSEHIYRLPTEAEWEYACRAGTTETYSFGDDAGMLGDYAWYFENAGRVTHAVGEKEPNAWGLYDMHGNVWEWVQDWHAPNYYQKSPAADPTGPETGGQRVIRGGCWDDSATEVRSTFRGSGTPGKRYHTVGFRLVREGP